MAISADTYDPLLNYVSVRLQQGVPLVDSDWNERDDIRRAELRAFWRWFVGDGVLLGSDAFRITVPAGGLANDFVISAGISGAAEPLRNAGRILVDGRAATITQSIRYSEQVAPSTGTSISLPRMVASGTDQTLFVYLDVFEHLITDSDVADGSLRNPDLMVETCARIKQEWLVRFGPRIPTGTRGDAPDPLFEPGHSYYGLAMLRRRSGVDRVDATDITDLREQGLSALPASIIPDLGTILPSEQSPVRDRLQNHLRRRLNAAIRGEHPALSPPTLFQIELTAAGVNPYDVKLSASSAVIISDEASFDPLRHRVAAYPAALAGEDLRPIDPNAGVDLMPIGGGTFGHPQMRQHVLLEGGRWFGAYQVTSATSITTALRAVALGGSFLTTDVILDQRPVGSAVTLSIEWVVAARPAFDTTVVAVFLTDSNNVRTLSYRRLLERNEPAGLRIVNTASARVTLSDYVETYAAHCTAQGVVSILGLKRDNSLVFESWSFRTDGTIAAQSATTLTTSTLGTIRAGSILAATPQQTWVFFGSEREVRYTILEGTPGPISIMSIQGSERPICNCNRSFEPMYSFTQSQGRNWLLWIHSNETGDGADGPPTRELWGVLFNGGSWSAPQRIGAGLLSVVVEKISETRLWVALNSIVTATSFELVSRFIDILE